uniref:Uncharacterized protein n=2 Tax=Avena sativa TaxID=4498 RepID=A0ACD5WK68_AVESA
MEDSRHGRRWEVPGGPGCGGGRDLISDLPEDLLLQVLLRLRCTAAAARTSILSRRWRGLWIRLPDLIFHGVPVRSIQAALSSLQGAVDHGVSLLDIAFASSLQLAAKVSLVDSGDPGNEQVDAGVLSLIHAAAGLSPVEFHLALPKLRLERIDFPRFHRATTIQLYAPEVRLTLPRASGGFPALETLSLFACRVDLTALVLLCPCLRVLRVSKACLEAGVNIQSESLQKLFVRTHTKFGWTDCINVEAPMLQQLTLSFHTGDELSVSVMAPALEKVSWECSYSISKMTAGLDPWSLSKVSFHAAASLGHRAIIGAEKDTCLQLTNVNVLSLEMTAIGWFQSELNFVQQIEKHLVTDFSILELLMMEYDYGKRSAGHFFGPFVLCLLGSRRIRTATRRLQILFRRSKVKDKCPVNCPCDEPKNWRSKNISLINLEEVEIIGFEWEDHEFDFLKVILRCAPMLKRMTVRGSDEATTSNDRCMKVHEVFKEYPFVECNLMRR